MSVVTSIFTSTTFADATEDVVAAFATEAFGEALGDIAEAASAVTAAVAAGGGGREGSGCGVFIFGGLPLPLGELLCEGGAEADDAADEEGVEVKEFVGNRGVSTGSDMTDEASKGAMSASPDMLDVDGMRPF